ncbi:MAG: hypothetical protein V8S96_01010 [Lachnospiraceae bacterium]
MVGIDSVDETYTGLTNGIRDAIQPDVTMFIRYVLQDNHVIRIEIGEGSYKPYYLKGKGIKPAGVYVRQGAASVQASPEQIRQMIKDSDGDVFEEMRTMQEDLTFEEAKAAFKRYKVVFSEDKFIALGLRNIHDDQYTNLAQLLPISVIILRRSLCLVIRRILLLKMQGNLADRFLSSLMTVMLILHYVIGQLRGFRDWNGLTNPIILRRQFVKHY